MSIYLEYLPADILNFILSKLDNNYDIEHTLILYSKEDAYDITPFNIMRLKFPFLS